MDAINLDKNTKCTKCGAKVEADWAICPICGDHLNSKENNNQPENKQSINNLRCIRCGHVAEAHWRVCPMCGEGLQYNVSQPSPQNNECAIDQTKIFNDNIEKIHRDEKLGLIAVLIGLGLILFSITALGWIGLLALLI